MGFKIVFYKQKKHYLGRLAKDILFHFGYICSRLKIIIKSVYPSYLHFMFKIQVV